MGCGLLLFRVACSAFRSYNSLLSPPEISHRLRLIQSHGPSGVQAVIKISPNFATHVKKQSPAGIEKVPEKITSQEIVQIVECKLCNVKE